MERHVVGFFYRNPVILAHIARSNKDLWMDMQFVNDCVILFLGCVFPPLSNISPFPLKNYDFAGTRVKLQGGFEGWYLGIFSHQNGPAQVDHWTRTSYTRSGLCLHAPPWQFKTVSVYIYIIHYIYIYVTCVCICFFFYIHINVYILYIWRWFPKVSCSCCFLCPSFIRMFNDSPVSRSKKMSSWLQLSKKRVSN